MLKSNNKKATCKKAQAKKQHFKKSNNIPYSLEQSPGLYQKIGIQNWTLFESELYLSCIQALFKI